MRLREMIMGIVLLVTLIIGIIMALCISLVIKRTKPKRTQTVTYIPAHGLSLMQMNQRCNCGIKGLHWKYKEKSSTLSTIAPGDDDDDGRRRAFVPRSENKKQEFKNEVGPDVFYDEIQHMKSLGLTDQEIFSRAFDSMANRASFPSSITMASTPDVTTAQTNFVINDQVIQAIWNAIKNKKLNITFESEGKIIKRSIPKEAPHCFLPIVKIENSSENKPHKKWKYHPFLISISRQRYQDDLDDLRYLCSGVIVDKQHAVTGKSCLLDNLNGKFLKIRTGSVFWSKQGDVHDVLHISTEASLALLKVHPTFKVDDSSLENLKMNKVVSVVDTVSSAGWLKNDRRRFSRYTVVRWGNNCKHCKTLAYSNKTDCENFIGDPLIKRSSILVGKFYVLIFIS